MTDRLIREGNPPAGKLASPVAQYWNADATDFERVEGVHGAPRAILYGPDGNPISSSNPLSVVTRDGDGNILGSESHPLNAQLSGSNVQANVFDKISETITYDQYVELLVVTDPCILKDLIFVDAHSENVSGLCVSIRNANGSFTRIFPHVGTLGTVSAAKNVGMVMFAVERDEPTRYILRLAKEMVFPHGFRIEAWNSDTGNTRLVTVSYYYSELR